MFGVPGPPCSPPLPPPPHPQLGSYGPGYQDLSLKRQPNWYCTQFQKCEKIHRLRVPRVYKKVLNSMEVLMDHKKAISTRKSEKFEVLNITKIELDLPGVCKNMVYSIFQK